MRASVGLGVLVLVASGGSALAQEAGSPHEAVVKGLIAATDQVATVLGTIKDGASAGEARPALKKAAEQFLEVRKKAEGLKQPDQREKERLEREYRRKMDLALTRLREEITRVRMAGGEEALQELSILEPRPRDEPAKEPKK